MTFKEQLISDLDDMFDEEVFADTCHYTPSGGVGVDISCIFDYDENVGESPLGKAEFAHVLIRKDEIPTPGNYDSLVYAGVEWRVLSVLSGDGYVWNIRVNRSPKGKY